MSRISVRFWLQAFSCNETKGIYSEVSNKPPSPTLDWYALQSGLEHAESDVLILLDSCTSAGSSGGSKQFETQEGGRTELLAACGFENSAPGPGPHSFTNALIRELRDMSTLNIPFAVNILHQRLIARLVHYSPQYSSVSPRQRCPERHATPVYISLGQDFRQKSIPLRSFRIPNNSGGNATSSSGSIGDPKAASTDGSQPNRTALAIKRLLGDNNAPKVLLAINLQGEHWLNFENLFGNWLKDMPLPADSINIEAVFHGLSTMILLSMPIAVWDLLPEHPSCSFVNFVQSPNLLPSPMSLCCLSPSKGEEIVHATDNILDSGPGSHLSRAYLKFKEKYRAWSVWVESSMSGAKWVLLTSLVLFFIRFLIQYGWIFVDIGDGPTLVRKSNQWTIPIFKDRAEEVSTGRRELIESLGKCIFQTEGSTSNGATYRIVVDILCVYHYFSLS